MHNDFHASYVTHSSLGFTDFTINHSRNIVGHDGMHTNWIEGIFGSMKKFRRNYDAKYVDFDGLEQY
ncbi:MAG: hypothetical protein ACRCZ9_10675 [Fusobacteriaceae bacterium]